MGPGGIRPFPGSREAAWLVPAPDVGSSVIEVQCLPKPPRNRRALDAEHGRLRVRQIPDLGSVRPEVVSRHPLRIISTDESRDRAVRIEYHQWPQPAGKMEPDRTGEPYEIIDAAAVHQLRAREQPDRTWAKHERIGPLVGDAPQAGASVAGMLAQQ